MKKIIGNVILLLLISLASIATIAMAIHGSVLAVAMILIIVLVKALEWNGTIKK